jgi:uncharacterized protein YndB with AHSA1/START domain
MTTMIKPAPVRRAITVEATVERAFDVFTAGFGRWWPASYSIGNSPLKNAVIEPRSGGRWYEVGQDGAECEWGEVLEWDAPSRLLLAWRIRSDWRYDPDLLTEVEVRFVALGENLTRVELEHRRLENLGEGAEAARATFDSEHGWGGILASYAATVQGSAA